MTNRTLAFIGIGVYIFSVITSAEDLSGVSVVPKFIVVLSGIIRIAFILMAIFRLWNKSKFASILLLASTVIHIGLTIAAIIASPTYESPPIVAMNIAKGINTIFFIWAIYALWKGDSTSQKTLPLIPEIPVIGKDIIWNKIIGQVFRVLEFDRNETMINRQGLVKARNYFIPYGYLLVESPIYSHQLILPITHKTDFYLACTAYYNEELKQLLKYNDLLVTYIPKRKMFLGFTGKTRAIHFVVTAPFTLNKYYGSRAHITSPKPEKLFGSFLYEGMVQIEINLHPNLQNDNETNT